MYLSVLHQFVVLLLRNFRIRIFLLIVNLYFQGFEHNSSQYLHHLIESVQLAFADGLQFIADPSIEAVPTTELLSKQYAEKRRTLIHKDR